MPQMKANEPLVHGELSEAVIGCAMTVLNTLRCGLPEKIYERALAIELRKRGHRVETQKEFPIYYDGVSVGVLIPDVLVDDLLIVDTKVSSNFAEDHIAQMLGCLAITGLELALLINFRYQQLRWKRVIRQRSE